MTTTDQAYAFGILWAYQNLIGAGLIALAISSAGRLVARAIRGDQPLQPRRWVEVVTGTNKRT